LGRAACDSLSSCSRFRRWRDPNPPSNAHQLGRFSRSGFPSEADYHEVAGGPSLELRLNGWLRFGAALLVGVARVHYLNGDGGYQGSNLVVKGELSVLVDLAHVRRAGSPYVRLSGVLGYTVAWGGALTVGWRL
jgi:hypothetical protein